MQLLDFPPEILARVTHFLGPDFFKANLGCVTLCKAWRPHAQREIQSHVALSMKQLGQFYNHYPSSCQQQSGESIGWATPMIQTFRVNVDGALCGSFPGYEGETHWILRRLSDERGQRFFGYLGRLRGLRKLTIDFRVFDGIANQRRPLLLRPQCGDAGPRSLHHLSRVNFASLRELSLNFTENGAFLELVGENQCLCPLVNKVLTRCRTVRTARLQFSFICPKLFYERPTADRPIALDTLHIYCDVGNPNTYIPWDQGPSLSCGGLAYRETRQRPKPGKIAQQAVNELATDLAARAAWFADGLQAPKAVRIVFPDILSLEEHQGSGGWNCQEEELRMFLWDCLQDKVQTFLRSEDWDRAEGNVVVLKDELTYWERKAEREDEEFRRLARERHSW